MKLSVNILGTLAVYSAGAPDMTRSHREELNRKLAQARRLALEPSDSLTRERLAQLIEELEFQLQDQRKVA
jgi:DNA-binding SARP family transcriptional activator